MEGAENVSSSIHKLQKLILNDSSTTCWNAIGVKVPEVNEGESCSSCSKEKCAGFSSHSFRKVCTNCKCPQESHIGRLEAAQNGHSTNGYSWAPPGISPIKVEDYFNQLPNHKVPRIGSPGEYYRVKQLMLQLPKQDLNISYCNHVEEKDADRLQDFVNSRNEIALDVGYVKENNKIKTECSKCGGVLEVGDVSIVASKLGEDVSWHPACFVCSTCDELLVDLSYCANEGQLYCERHYAETVKPRCAGCDELIYSGEYCKAMEKNWHYSHFRCWNCEDSLTGQRYAVRDTQAYCTKCYEQLFSNPCEECQKSIGIDCKDLCYKDKHWHESCFQCHKCKVTLVDQVFGSQNEKLYCDKCYRTWFAMKCDGCDQAFETGTKKVVYKEQMFHEKCFNCCVCKNSIGGKSFVPKDDDFYCSGCYEDKFSSRCVKCNKIISAEGVTYKGDPWHKECFTCSHCNIPLAGQRFTTRDEKHYCTECFGELFAKRCTSCNRPISGGVAGGSRFISFEERHWHNDCFVCSNCKCSLVGKGFIADGADILCSDCAKQRIVPMSP